MDGETEQSAKSVAPCPGDAQMRAVFEHPSLYTLLLGAERDADGRIVDWVYRDANANALRMTGHSRAQLLGRRVGEMIPDRAPRLASVCARVLSSGNIERYDSELGGRLFDITVYPAGGDTVVSSALDITERRRAEAALQEADRRKDEFLAMLAHELRNPLTPISNAAAALLQILPPERSQERLLAEMVGRQASQLARLIDDLLDVARITQGRIELRMEQVLLQDCLDAAVETAEPLLRSKRQQLLLAQPLESLYVTGDRARLSQSISNLLLNAVKYTGAGGEIRVRHYSEAGQVVLEIADTGIGISAELLPHVFELFLQGDRTLDRSQGGLGVGLAICKQLIEMHGGTVTAQSEGVARGATFVIRLPIAEAPHTTDSKAQRRSSPQRRVLIVDDNQDAADSLALVLRLEGHEAWVAYSGETAIEAARVTNPDFILLDIGLPHMDGYEVARRIRGCGSAARLVALTGYGQPADRQRSADAGFAAHLVKPVDVATLRAMLSRDEG